MRMLQEVEPRLSVNNAKKLKYEEIVNMSWSPVDIALRNSSASKFMEIDTFAKMRKLKLLQLNYVQITGSFEKFPKRLRWLSWHGFPLRTIPDDFPMESLVAVDMQYSSLQEVWKGTKSLVTLKILDLSHSHGLTKTPDFSRVPNLESLILEDCVNLVEVHESIGELEELILLNLKDCKNLRLLPKNICMLKLLKTLVISGCLNIINWSPIDFMTMGFLKVPRAAGIAINHTPSSPEEGQSWLEVILSWLSKPRRSQEILSISLPCSLVKLSLAGCNLCDDAFPLDFSNLHLLRILDLSATQISSLPECIRALTSLQTLIVNSCKRLKSLTSVPNAKLAMLHVIGCSSLERISYQSTLSAPVNLICRSCNNLLEVQGLFILETIKSVDMERLKRWGFLNLESMGNVELNYFRVFASPMTKKLPLQRLYETGVHSYFLPGDKVPRTFHIERSSFLHFVLPSHVDSKIRGLVVCCVYTTRKTEMLMRYELFQALNTVIANKTKHVNYCHQPMSFGAPKTNEAMLWASVYNFGDLLEGGDEIEVSVNVISPFFTVKEVGILPVYEQQEQEGAQSMPEAAVQVTVLGEDTFTSRNRVLSEKYSRRKLLRSSKSLMVMSSVQRRIHDDVMKSVRRQR